MKHYLLMSITTLHPYFGLLQVNYRFSIQNLPEEVQKIVEKILKTSINNV